MAKRPDVIHLDPKNSRLFVLVNNKVETANITTWFDEFGDECAPHGGHVCVAEYSKGWLTIDLRDWAPELPN